MHESNTKQKESEMISKIFVNLPVKDLDKSMGFFKAIGFSFKQTLTASSNNSLLTHKEGHHACCIFRSLHIVHYADGLASCG